MAGRCRWPLTPTGPFACDKVKTVAELDGQVDCLEPGFGSR
jgi:hypothetical protein